MIHRSLRGVFASAIAAVLLAAPAAAQFDITGSWQLQWGSNSAVLAITQSGSALAVTQPGFEWEGTIDVNTGVFSLQTTDETIAFIMACGLINATVALDGDHFSGDLASASLECTGLPPSCQCGAFTTQPVTGVRLAVCGDGTVSGGEACDDGNTVGGDCCSATCTFESAGAPCADDGEACTVDLCDGAGTCHGPHGGCRTASTGARISLRDAGDGSHVRWGWKDASGLTTPADLGTPTGTTAYHLCVFAGDALLFAGDVPPGAGWQAQPHGFTYKAGGDVPDGVGTLKLRAKTPKTKLFAKGKGALVTFAGSLAVPTVRAQLLRDDGAVCWDAIFDQPKISQPDRFLAKE